MEYPGPYSKSSGICNEHILKKQLPKVDTLTNGTILELFSFTKQRHWTLNDFVQILVQLKSGFSCVKVATISSKINRISGQKKSLLHRKKVNGVTNLDDLLSREFLPPVPVAKHNQQTILENGLKSDSVKQLCTTSRNLSKPCPIQNECVGVAVTSDISVQTEDCYENDVDNRNLTKTWNMKKYLCIRESRKLSKLKKHVASFDSKIVDQNNRIGHYSIKNVNKRDETARKNLRLLRSAQRTVTLNNVKLKKTESDLTKLSDKINHMTVQNQTMKETIQQLSSALHAERDKKLLVQKRNSNLKKQINEVKTRQLVGVAPSHDKCNDIITQLQLKLEEKQMEIDVMQLEIDDKTSNNETSVVRLSTKNDDGTYANELRLCVIDLFGLEIGVEKISQAVRVVSKHLFRHEFKKNDLPTSSSVQNIVDEGHFLAKTFISEKLAASDTWGISRDGTTRKKKKILDTSVTLDTGDVFSLGFSQVARETAAAITDVTKAQISELAAAHSSANSTNAKDSLSESYVLNSLQKLSFTMSDRASNEKLADKFLSDWRENMLKKCVNNEEISCVKNFHCMAHVLLGFHRYVCDDLKLIEQKLVETIGPLGRDTLPVFRTWSKKDTAFARAVRTTSDIFGPAGDHNGVRDRWEAYCAKHGIKSLIGNYRDNRFNAIFQTAAEICVHLEDFLQVIRTVSNPNLKIKAVLADLQSSTVQTSMKCLAQVYIKVTGPYWWLVTSGTSSYMELYPHIQSLESYLEICALNPSKLLENDFDWYTCEDMNIPHADILRSALIHENPSELLLQMVSCSCSAMLKTVRKQLSDFLEGGQFSKEPSKEDLTRTACSQVTNLACEHHFGDLDSSQRRRPNASIHHHSSVQMLKRNRKELMLWLEDMPVEKQTRLMKSARKFGPSLRRKHRTEEENVKLEIFTQMDHQPKPKKRKTRETSLEREEISSESELSKSLPHQEGFSVSEYVAVAYQDNWYPGVVEKVTDKKTALVRFMMRCRKDGHFQWPLRKDQQIVNMDFILKRDFVPNCVSSGRQWLIVESSDIDKLYQLFDTAYFE